MNAKIRPYLFYDTAISVCTTCLRRVEAKILLKDECVYLEKWCPEHGRERVLIADDIAYYRKAREVFIKAPEMPKLFNTKMEYGCPYDCGICPEHMQHSCLTLIEITDQCNLACPICYADSGPHRPGFKSLKIIERMMDNVVANEGEPDVVQISGGEPTIHPDFFAILDAAKRRPIRHLMVNTNGLKIAKDREFTKRLAAYQPGFELYLQFDSLDNAVHEELRGAKLRDIRLQALAHLNEFDISTTLVVTVKKGLNDHQLGEIIQFASEQPCVRGVTFQPIQAAGRLENFDPARDRLTLTEVRRKILEQSDFFEPEDMIPVPCNPDCLSMGYALKVDGKIHPLTRYIDPQTLIEAGRNTIVVERDTGLRDQLFKLFSTAPSPESQAAKLSDLLCCLPQICAPEGLTYKNVFRVLIMQFIDAYSFDLRAVKKSCVHIAQEDGTIIPFDTFNMFYRDDRKLQLGKLRAMHKQFVY
jgi:7,8-dihydro-6-hydroxymethylpterin dimethyltransferase